MSSEQSECAWEVVCPCTFHLTHAHPGCLPNLNNVSIISILIFIDLIGYSIKLMKLSCYIVKTDHDVADAKPVSETDAFPFGSGKSKPHR